MTTGRFKPIPKANFLREIFTYLPETGKLFWNVRKDVPNYVNTRFVGKEAGSWSLQGLTVRLFGEAYFVHRIIYVIVYGDCLNEDDEVDHEDLDKYNNRQINLRKADHMQNNANKTKQKNNTSGAKSIERLPGGSWRARIAGIHIGCFSSIEEAASAYDRAAERIYGEFGRVSLPAKQT